MLDSLKINSLSNLYPNMNYRNVKRLRIFGRPKKKFFRCKVPIHNFVCINNVKIAFKNAKGELDYSHKIWVLVTVGENEVKRGL